LHEELERPVLAHFVVLFILFLMAFYWNL